MRRKDGVLPSIGKELDSIWRLNFGARIVSSQEENLNITGPQFLDSGLNAKLIAYTFTAVTEETIYTVPTGKTLFVTKIVINNVDPVGGKTWFVNVDSVPIWITNVAVQEYSELDFPSAMKLVAGTVLSGISSDIGSTIAVIGWGDLNARDRYWKYSNK